MLKLEKCVEWNFSPLSVVSINTSSIIDLHLLNNDYLWHDAKYVYNCIIKLHHFMILFNLHINPKHFHSPCCTNEGSVRWNHFPEVKLTISGQVRNVTPKPMLLTSMLYCLCRYTVPPLTLPAKCLFHHCKMHLEMPRDSWIRQNKHPHGNNVRKALHWYTDEQKVALHPSSCKDLHFLWNDYLSWNWDAR